MIVYFLLTAHGFQKPQSINAGMAELADAYGSGPYDSNIMRVQVSFPACENLSRCTEVFCFTSFTGKVTCNQQETVLL